MKTIKEIKSEANIIYTRSSHYIVGTFMAVTATMTIIKSVLQVIGVNIGINYLFILAALFSPIEYGMVKAAILAYEHKAREVKTASYALAGLKRYFHIMFPFIGKTAIVYLLQTLVLAIFIYWSSHSLNDLAFCLNVVLTGDLGSLFVDGELILLVGSLIGVVVSIIIGFVVDAYFCLAYYYVVEDDAGLWRSLTSSAKAMSGHFWTYVLLRLNYLPFVILSTIIVNIFSIAFQTMFQQLLTIMPTVPVIVFNVILVIIVGLISALVSTMLYKVKETLAITVFYKEIRHQQ